MNTIEEVKHAFDRLNSEEGTFQFIAQRTCLSPERVERIYRLGYPWPLLEEAPELKFFEGIRNGEPTTEGVSAKGAIEALSELRQLDNEIKEEKLKAFEKARDQGKLAAPIPELDWPDLIKDHLKEVARLSGEELSTIYDVFGKELSRLQRLQQLMSKVVCLKAQGET